MQIFFKQFQTLFLFKSRLARRFLFFTVLVSTIPIVLMGVLALFFLNSNYRRSVSELENQVLIQKEQEMLAFAEEITGIFRLHFDSSEEKLVIEVEPEEGRQNPFCRLSGKRYFCYNVNKEFLDSVLDGIILENDSVDSAYFIDLSGRVISFSGRHLAAEVLDEDMLFSNLSNIPFLARVFNGSDYFGGINYTPSGSRMMIASPVKNRDGKVIAAILGEINLKRVGKIINRTILGTTGYAFLVDGDGILIAHSISVLEKERMDLSSLKRTEDVLSGRGRTGLEDEDKFVSIFGQEVVAAGKKIPKLNWGLFVEWPTADAEAVIEIIRSQVINFTFVSLIMVLIVVFLITGRLMRPLRELEKGVKAMGEGNFDYRVNIKSKDELEDLGNAFNLAGKALKELQNLKNEFVFIAAHELRTPVAAIKGYLSMLFEDMPADSSKLKTYLDPVWKSSERLAGLVNNLLEVACSEAGRLKIELSAQNIKEIVLSQIEEQKPLVLKKNISLKYESAKLQSMVMADGDKLKEVVMNLLSNAVKYNRPGGEVNIFHEIKENYLITHIQDTGVGISDEDQKKLFTKFFRAKTPEITAAVGTGLGMFISKELVERMGGKIWVKSELGKGSTFSFSLKPA